MAVSDYLIAFVDILGQKDKILSLGNLPWSPTEKVQADEVLHDTADFVSDLRKQFLDSFKERNRPDYTILGPLSLIQRVQFLHLRRSLAKVRGISDSIIITVPLYHGNDYTIPVNGIYAALFSICGMFVASLGQEKAALRGGIDIGWGVPLPHCKNEIYGAAVVKAHILEQDVAQYPRIIIGDSLSNYLDHVVRLESSCNRNIWAKKYADYCKSLIVTDYDHLRILDVIGDMSKKIGLPQQWVRDAYSYVVAQHKYYQTISDIKLYPRYGMLRSYFESKLHLWDIPPQA